MEDRIEQTRHLYDSFVFGGDADALGVAERQLDAVRADLALARGRIVHGRFLERGDADPRELAAGQGRHDDARAIIDEARTIAEASQAHGTLRSIEEVHVAIAS